MWKDMWWTCEQAMRSRLYAGSFFDFFPFSCCRLCYFVFSALPIGDLNTSMIAFIKIWGNCPCLFTVVVVVVSWIALVLGTAIQWNPSGPSLNRNLLLTRPLFQPQNLCHTFSLFLTSVNRNSSFPETRALFVVHNHILTKKLTLLNRMWQF